MSKATEQLCGWPMLRLPPQYETVGDAYVVAVNLDKPDPMHAITALK